MTRVFFRASPPFPPCRESSPHLRSFFALLYHDTRARRIGGGGGGEGSKKKSNKIEDNGGEIEGIPVFECVLIYSRFLPRRESGSETGAQVRDDISGL